MLLAGDIGGTKTLLGLFTPGADRPEPTTVRQFVTLDYDSLDAIIDEFLDAVSPTPPIEAACFGVAGPVLNGTARLTNVPWVVDAHETRARLSIPRVNVLNDLEAMAWSITVLRPDELAVLQEGEPTPTANAAIIAAGTGLGEALLHNVGGKFHPVSSEGGHADFAARTDREIALLRDVIARFGRAQYEAVLSGPGLVNIHRFTHPEACPAVPDPASDDAPAQISAAALAHACAHCVDALELFVAIYGAEAGNLALRAVATAGVYIGGGIAPHILPALQIGGFMRAFLDKAPMNDLIARIPVKVILNQRAALLGAAVRAGAGGIEN
jgi:glucokinase